LDLTRTARKTVSFNIYRNVGRLDLTSHLTLVFRVLLSASLSHITNITERERERETHLQKMPLCLPFFIPLLDVTPFFIQAQTSVGNTSSNSDPAVSNTSFCTFFFMSLCTIPRKVYQRQYILYPALTRDEIRKQLCIS